jgi:uncharacterized protein (TIGR02996 family)
VTERDQFEADIASDPHNYELRAVYSDFLEEHGESEAAAWHRMLAEKRRRPTTVIERRAMLAISPGPVTYTPGSFDKKFSREMSEEASFHGDNATLTPRQAWWLWHHVHRYRRQIHARDLLEEAERHVNDAEPPKKNRSPGNGVTETTRERKRRMQKMPKVPGWLAKR